MEASTNYDSKFNMAFMKLARIDKQLKIAEHAANEDLHALWRTALDNIRRELYGYLNKDDRDSLDKHKKACQEKLLAYLNWMGRRGDQVSNHHKQNKQLELESALDKYHTTLIEFMKKTDMDMPKKDDMRAITKGGRF